MHGRKVHLCHNHLSVCLSLQVLQMEAPAFVKAGQVTITAAIIFAITIVAITIIPIIIVVIIIATS